MRPKLAIPAASGPAFASPVALALPASDPILGLVPTGSGVQSMKDLHAQLQAQHLKSWLALLDTAGDASSLVCATAHSELAAEHRLKAVSHYAPSTMSMYLRTWDLWYDFALCHNCSAYEPPASVVADYLHVHSSNQGLASSHLRALTWVSRCAGFPELLAVLQTQMVRSYGVASEPQPRREAPPLPLSFVIWLEQCILSQTDSVADRLAMGGFLLMLWGSLRWSDVQWVRSWQCSENKIYKAWHAIWHYPVWIFGPYNFGILDLEMDEHFEGGHPQDLSEVQWFCAGLHHPCCGRRPGSAGVIGPSHSGSGHFAAAEVSADFISLYGCFSYRCALLQSDLSVLEQTVGH